MYYQECPSRAPLGLAMGPTVASGSRKEPYCTYRLQCTLQNKVTSHGTRTRRACHRKLSSREPPLTLGLTRTALVAYQSRALEPCTLLWSHVPPRNEVHPPSIHQTTTCNCQPRHPGGYFIGCVWWVETTIQGSRRCSKAVCNLHAALSC